MNIWLKEKEREVLEELVEKLDEKLVEELPLRLVVAELIKLANEDEECRKKLAKRLAEIAQLKNGSVVKVARTGIFVFPGEDVAKRILLNGLGADVEATGRKVRIVFRRGGKYRVFKWGGGRALAVRYLPAPEELIGVYPVTVAEKDGEIIVEN